MSTITKERAELKAFITGFLSDPAHDNQSSRSMTAEVFRIALASLEAEAVPEWTNEQCLEFLSIAFRHAEINGDLELDDIRLGVKMVSGSRAAMLQGAEQTNYRAIVERIAEIIHGKVTDIDLLTVTVKSMKDKLQK
ncbi:hypothetical protein ACTVDX_001533 [Enterobacter hormaechei]